MTTTNRTGRIGYVREALVPSAFCASAFGVCGVPAGSRRRRPAIRGRVYRTLPGLRAVGRAASRPVGLARSCRRRAPVRCRPGGATVELLCADRDLEEPGCL